MNQETTGQSTPTLQQSWTSNSDFLIGKDERAISIYALGENAQAWLKEIFHRATNLWPDAPPEIKELADLVIDGEVKQNYRAQDTSPKEKSNG